MTFVRDREYWFCKYCHSLHFPSQEEGRVKVLGQESDYQCPAGGGTLVAATIEGIEVLRCDRCRGLLIDQQAFPSLIEFLRAWATDPPSSPRPLDRKDLEREIACPHCQERMDTHPYYGPGNVVIDVCVNCGVIWLDHGELDNIVDAPGSDRGKYGARPPHT